MRSVVVVGALALCTGAIAVSAWRGSEGCSAPSVVHVDQRSNAGIFAAAPLAPQPAQGTLSDATPEPMLVRPPTPARRPVTTTEAPQNIVTIRRDSAPILRSGQGGPLERGGDRYEMARQLQRELVRVGCYVGDADGDWGGASKRAMQSFLDRVNAVLPVDEPDPVLLAMLRSQKSGICAGGCRTGEVVGSEGRCIPTGLMAGRTDQRNVVITPARPAPSLVPSQSWSTEVAVAPQPVEAPLSGGAALPGRMALGGVHEPLPAAPAVTGATPVKDPLPPSSQAPPPRPAKSKSSGNPPAWVRNTFPSVYN